MAPLLVAIVSLFIAAATIVFCHRTRKLFTSPLIVDHSCVDVNQTGLDTCNYKTVKWDSVVGQARTMKETLDNQQNAEAQRERYYATIHKVAMQQSNDKIPGNGFLFFHTRS